MAVLGREDFLAKIKGRFGEELSDEDVSFIEDMTDTFDNFDSRLKESGDWKSKYEENDKAWRKKYVDRFSGNSDEEDGEDPTEDNDSEDSMGIMSYEELFKGE